MVIFGGGASGSAYKDAFGLTLPDDERGRRVAHAVADAPARPPATR